MAAEQEFTARHTFDAVFGHANQPFLGGGLQVVFRHGLFVELGASQFKKTGQRAFRFNGQNFRLGIPLTATLTPFEVTGGYRFRFPKYLRIVPYAGAGFGSYGYKERSDFSDAGETLDTRHAGLLAAGGVEIRVHRWVGVAVDAQYTHIPGILGAGGVSQNLADPKSSDDDLGGIAARFKIVVGK